MRRIIQTIFISALLLTNYSFLDAHCGCGNPESGTWRNLRKGNQEFVDSKKYAKQRKPLVNAQDPHSVILSCADSRVPPEIIFSQKLGELFVVRSAGQVTDDVVVDTIEFAVRTFNPATLVVMGHTDCGAVKGALARLRANGGVIDKQQGHLLAVLIPIEKAIVASGMDIYASDALQQATRVNVEYIANQLIDQSKPIAKAVKSGKVVLIGAEYDLATGRVKELFRF